jgi:hypothetical protein
MFLLLGPIYCWALWVQLRSYLIKKQGLLSRKPRIRP